MNILSCSITRRLNGDETVQLFSVCFVQADHIGKLWVVFIDPNGVSHSYRYQDYNFSF